MAAEVQASTDTRVSIIVPTLNPGKNLPELQKALARQSPQPLEVVIVDSASTDGSPGRWRAAGSSVFHIERANFDHGGARNYVASRSLGNILVFMTQDAIPANEQWLANLISPIVSGEVVATFARQLPKKDANPLERFARNFNYPAESRIQTLADVHKIGYKAFFFSNVCSAIRTDVFWQVGGFQQGIIVNEDVLLCAKLLRAGYKVKYEAKAQVFHSHDYGLLQQFKRYFDLGASISRTESCLKGARVGTEGLKFVKGQASYMINIQHYFGLFKVFAEAAVKLMAFHLGRRERWIPCSLKRRLSRHSFVWEC